MPTVKKGRLQQVINFMSDILADRAKFPLSTSYFGFAIEQPRQTLASMAQDLFANKVNVGEPARAGNANATSWNDGTYPGASGPQAMVMLANIEITDSGDLVLGFRDRSNDNVTIGYNAY